jgi:arginase
MKVSLVTLAYNVQGKGHGGGGGPEALLRSGVVDRLVEQGHEVTAVRDVQLTEAEERSYGGWNRVGVANGHLANLVAEARAGGDFVLGLLADCNGVLGMLGGLTRGPEQEWPRRVGLVWIDAHGDYNTPETSPSGMLGGMPVAVAAGKCLHALRLQSGLPVPLQSPDVVMAGLRDLDASERAAIEGDGLICLSLEDLTSGSERLHWAMRNLSEREDIIYVHIDLDILDPDLAPAAGLPCKGGISGKELGAALATLLKYPKVQALAFVSYYAARDDDGRTLREVMDAILGATAGAGRAAAG